MADVMVDPFNPADSSTYPDPSDEDVFVAKTRDGERLAVQFVEDAPSESVQAIADDPPLPQDIEVGECWITDTQTDKIVWLVASPSHGVVSLYIEGQDDDEYVFAVNLYDFIGYAEIDEVKEGLEDG